MKKILLALAAAMSVGGALAHDHPNGKRHGHERGEYREWRHEHREVRIDDRIERRTVWRGDRKILVTTTFTCTEQRRGRCLNWEKSHVERQVLRRNHERY